MSTPTWTPLGRNYEVDASKCAVKLTTAVVHPLQPSRPKEAKTSPSKPNLSTAPIRSGNIKTPIRVVSSGKLEASDDPLSSFVDPLSSMSISSPITDPLLNNSNNNVSMIDDPLSTTIKQSKTATETRHQTIEGSRQAAKAIHEDNLNTPWNNRKQQILKDYAVSGNIILNSNSINEFSGSGVEDGSATRHLDKYTSRLASLEKRNIQEDSNEKVTLTQLEYKTHINKLTSDLEIAWKKDERVQSLKIAIQIAKLLNDTNILLFYPSNFILVTTALDKFGDMVYQRLCSRANEYFQSESIQHNHTTTTTGTANTTSTTSKTKKLLKLSEYFTSNDVPNVAKEICRNWFYKVACIRELLPRIYIEVALFRCYRFLTDTDFQPILSRIGSIIRGIGNPMIALYLRTYLVVVCNTTIPHMTTFAQTMLSDSIITLSAVQEPYMIKELSRLNISTAVYYNLVSPGMEWIVRTVGKSASREVFQNMLQLYREHSNDAMILKHFIDFFDGTYYSHAALGMATLIKSSTPSCASHVDLYTSLGKQLSTHPPPEEQRLPLLNEVWKVVLKSTDILAFVRCSFAWLDLVQRYYSEREMYVLLGNLATRLEETYTQDNKTEVPEQVLQQLEALISALIGQSSAFGTAVLTSEHLLKILDLFRGHRKVVLCKDIIESFKNQTATNDAVLINTLFDLCRCIHDSVDSLSPSTETLHIANLLNSFIGKINFGKDFEQQLNFYSDCRAAFCNIDYIKDKLIYYVCNLMMKTYMIMKGKHTKKTSTFVKACLAYCHITIPSITDAYRKLELLLYCSQISILNQCLPQTDTFLKAAITILPEMQAYYEEEGKKVHYEERLAGYLNTLLATLVIIPGHPDHGPFYLIQGLMNAIPRFPWQSGSAVQTRVYINILALLCTLAQKKFPYRIQGVQSNDELYGGAPVYMTELNEHIDTCIAEVLKQLTALGEKPEASAKLNQARAALDLANQLIARVELTPSVGAFVLKLLELANKQKSFYLRTDHHYMNNTVEYIIARTEYTTTTATIKTSTASSSVMSSTAAIEYISSLKQLLQ